MRERSGGREFPRHPVADGEGGPARRGRAGQGRAGGLPRHGPGGRRDRRRVRRDGPGREAGPSAGASLLHSLHAHAGLSQLRFPQSAILARRPPNRLSYHLARQIMWQAFRPADRLARREVLGLPAAPFWGPSTPIACGTPILYGYSPSVIPPAADWGDRHPRHRLLVPGSGRGLDAAPGPGGVPGRPARRRSTSASGA